MTDSETEVFSAAFDEGFDVGIWHAYCEMWQVAMLRHADLLTSLARSRTTLGEDPSELLNEAASLREFAKTTIPYLP